MRLVLLYSIGICLSIPEAEYHRDGEEDEVGPPLSLLVAPAREPVALHQHHIRLSAATACTVPNII